MASSFDKQSKHALASPSKITWIHFSQLAISTAYSKAATSTWTGEGGHEDWHLPQILITSPLWFRVITLRAEVEPETIASTLILIHLVGGGDQAVTASEEGLGGTLANSLELSKNLDCTDFADLWTSTWSSWYKTQFLICKISSIMRVIFKVISHASWVGIAEIGGSKINFMISTCDWTFSKSTLNPRQAKCQRHLEMGHSKKRCKLDYVPLLHKGQVGSTCSNLVERFTLVGIEFEPIL